MTQCSTCADTYNCPDCGVWTPEAYADAVQYRRENAMTPPALTQFIDDLDLQVAASFKPVEEASTRHVNTSQAYARVAREYCTAALDKLGISSDHWAADHEWRKALRRFDRTKAGRTLLEAKRVTQAALDDALTVNMALLKRQWSRNSGKAVRS